MAGRKMQVKRKVWGKFVLSITNKMFILPLLAKVMDKHLASF